MSREFLFDIEKILERAYMESRSSRQKHRAINRFDETRDEVRGNSYGIDSPLESVSARDPIHIAPTFTGGNAMAGSRVGVDSREVSRGPRNFADGSRGPIGTSRTRYRNFAVGSRELRGGVEAPETVRKIRFCTAG